MTIADDWQPPPCRHGAQPMVEQAWIDTGVPGWKPILGHKTLYYDCLTPQECVKEQLRIAERQYLRDHVSTANEAGHHQRTPEPKQHWPLYPYTTC